MEDRISTLPDEVLCHILSFLTTQISATTSILSKRWRPLWLSVPSLNFYDTQSLLHDEPYHGLRNSINKTLLARDVLVPIRTFWIQFRSSNFRVSDYDLKLWINLAIQRGLEDLHIRCLAGSSVTLKPCVFSCKTLVVLRLSRLDLDAFSIVDLPSLKTMELVDLLFPSPECLMKLLSGCPILEDMLMRNIYFFDGHYPNPVQNLSKLVKADIYEVGSDFGLYFPLTAICNVEFLRIDKYQPQIPVFPSLTRVKLIWWHHMNWYLVLAMLKQCPMLKKFTLVFETSPADDVVWIFPSYVPECLSSRLRKCCIKNYDGAESQPHFAKYIMQNSRVLQTMTISCAAELKVDKLELLKGLSLCPRISPICELSFT